MKSKPTDEKCTCKVSSAITYAILKNHHAVQNHTIKTIEIMENTATHSKTS